jgi:hypothetical protein
VDRNSLTYSFLPGDSLWDNRSCAEDVALAGPVQAQPVRAYSIRARRPGCNGSWRSVSKRLNAKWLTLPKP